MLTALILGSALSFLFSPPPQTSDEFWGLYIPLGEQTGFILNKDSYGYIQAAEEPGRLLQQNEERQSRPLYVLLGTALGYPLWAVLPSLVDEASVRAAVGPDVPLSDRALIGFYPAFVLLNFGVLLAALLLFARLYSPLTNGTGNLLTLGCLLVFLVSNPIVKAFFWTAHQQMFCFFTPLFCLWLLERFRQRPARPVRPVQWLGWALATGLLPLVYGNFVLVLPVLLYALWRQSGQRWTQKQMWSLAAGTVLLFLLPTVSWILLLKLRGVTYYNHEMARYHQLVWLAEAAQTSPAEFLTTVGQKLLEFAGTLSGLIGWLLAVPLLWLAARKRRQPVGPVVADAMFLLLLFGAFLAVLGYYNERLTFTLQPLLLCLSATALARLQEPGQRSCLVVTGLVVTVLAWHAYQVLSYGPFS
ncbi:hypothetical protein KBK19_04600 [Microvirga sp. STR05]|uniref:Glycosyltransferase RgtA/B/C/D-like domain-containing protein n=1 Tax=Hymenobacter duratus TaxID=2771356 RepID=A0ABR8JC97_9BACT|nr:hypothetical protein [Hymenobacter duratus]MBD2714308.1 hypothetical protein [Hymenobacter duratus]MBR7949211.1 hypothetical protein [Microvirga sp. STR05]